MSTPHDVLQLKTDAELRFFIENPRYYQPELVTAARRELQRRGPAAMGVPAVAAAPTAATAPSATAAPPAEVAPVLTATAVPATPVLPAMQAYAPVAEKAPTRPPWLLLGSIAAVIVVGGLGFWHKTPAYKRAPVAKTSPKPIRAHAPAPAPPQLETAVSYPLPTYDTEAYVRKALALVPAAEQRNEQRTSQYRAISRLFWAAQNPSAHLIRQAQAGQANPLFEAQARLVLGMWYDFNRTQVYRYTFEPGMADHLERMKIIARYQREALGELAADCAAKRAPVLNDDLALDHQRDIPTLLAPLEHKTGPAAAQK